MRGLNLPSSYNARIPSYSPELLNPISAPHLIFTAQISDPPAYTPLFIMNLGIGMLSTFTLSHTGVSPDKLSGGAPGCDGILALGVAGPTAKFTFASRCELLTDCVTLDPSFNYTKWSPQTGLTRPLCSKNLSRKLP